MNPTEQQREFREKLRERNPELADRYTRFLEHKRIGYTADWGYKFLRFNEIADYANTKIAEITGSPNRECAKTIAQLWFGHLRKKSRIAGQSRDNKPEDYEGDGMITLADFFGHPMDTGLDIKFYCLTDDFPDGPNLDDLIKLYIKAKEASDQITLVGRDHVDDKTRELQRIYFDLVAAQHKEGFHGEVGAFFYFDQFKRLEREMQIGTPHSEGVFMPYLREIAQKTESRRLLKYIKKYVIATPYLSLDDMRLAVALDTQETRDDKGGLSKEGKTRIAETIKFLDGLEEHIGESCPVPILYNHEVFCELLRNWGVPESYISDEYALYALDSAEAIFDINPFWKKGRGIREFERSLKVGEDCIGEDHEDLSTRNRLARYLLSLYRRNRKEIDELVGVE
jgi:hypothetical protein